MSFVQSVGRTARELVVQNFPLKAVSLGVAIAYFAFIHSAHDAQRSFEIGVVVLPSNDASRVLLEAPPTKVRVTLFGSKPIVDDLKAEDLGTVQLDLREQVSFAAFDLHSLSLPPGLRAQADPAGVSLRWDDLVLREVPVQISVTGQASAGVAVQSEVADPPRISLRGPRTIIETMQFARAEPFDISGLNEGTFTRKLVLDHAPNLTSFDVPFVSVTVKLTRSKIEKVFAKVPLRVVGPSKATATPAEVDVKVSGPPERVAALRLEHLFPTVSVLPSAADISKPGTITLPVEISVEGFNVTVSPDNVLVKW